MDEEWKAKDPLDRIRALLETAGVIDDDYLAAVQQQADQTAAVLRRGCLETVEPTALSMFDHVYAEPHPLVDEERRQFASYLDTLEGTH